MRNDLRDFEVHKIKPNKNEVTPMSFKDITEAGEIGYAKGGQAVDPESKESCCKTVTYGEHGELVTLYFVRIGIRGFMYDPWETDDTGSMSRYAQHFGRSTWEYQRVNKKAFDFYYRFIQSRNNKAWLRNAEREIG